MIFPGDKLTIHNNFNILSTIQLAITLIERLIEGVSNTLAVTITCVCVCVCACACVHTYICIFICRLGIYNIYILYICNIHSVCVYSQDDL